MAALMAVAAAALLLLVDANAFRPQIAQAVADRFKRTLHMDGDLRLSVFPRIAIVLPKTSLSERESERTFARLEHGRIGAALWPLLAGRLEVGRIEMTGLNATIERRADGSTSIDDLIGRDSHLPASEQGDRAVDGAGPEFSIAGLELVDAQLTLIDAGVPVLTVSKLDLSTGELRPKVSTPLALTAAFAVPMAKTVGALALAGTLDMDLAAGTYGAHALQARVDSTIENSRFDLQINVQRFSFGRSVSAEGLKLDLSRSESADLRVAIEVTAIDGTPQRLALHGLRMNADIAQAGRKIEARISGEAQASLEAQTLEFTALQGGVTVEAPALLNTALKLTLAGSGGLDIAQHTASLQLDASFDDTALKGRFDAGGAAPPKFRFDLEADRLELDRYLQPPRAEAGAPGRAARKIDLSALRGLDLAGQARIGQFQAAGVKANDVRIGMLVRDGRLDLAPLAASLYGGTLAGTAFAVAEGNRIGLDAKLERVAIEPLLRDALNHDLVAGTAEVRLDVTTVAGTAAQARQALSGSAAVRIRDGAIKGFDLVRRLRDAGDPLRIGRSEAQRADAGQRTEFAELGASFAIAEGVARNDDLAAASAQLRLAGAGVVDLGAESIDYTLRATLIRALHGADGRELAALRGLTIPVRLSGPLAQMTCDVNWPAAVRETITSRVTDLIPKATAPVEDRRKELVKR